MPHSRAVALLTVLLVVLAGCSSGPGTRPPIDATAEPGGLAPETVSELGLEPLASNTSTIETTLFASVQGDVELSTERQVEATTHAVSYRTEAGSAPVVVVVYSVPAVTLLEDTAPVVRDPAGSWTEARVARAIQPVYAVSTLEVASTSTGTMFGNQTTVRHVSGEGTTAGESVELVGTISRTRHQGDFVTVLILGPAGADRPETDAVLTGLVHPKK